MIFLISLFLFVMVSLYVIFVIALSTADTAPYSSAMKASLRAYFWCWIVPTLLLLLVLW